MTYRKVVNFLVFIVSILVVNLATNYISEWLLSYKHTAHPAKVTLIGMGLTVFILYPAYNWLDDISEKVTKHYFNAGRNATGKIPGLIIAFSISLLVLFLCYLHMWFGLSPLDLLG